MNLSNILLVTKTFTLRVLGYKNKKRKWVTKTYRESGLQKHTEIKKITQLQKHLRFASSVTKTKKENGLQKHTERVGYKNTQR